MRPLDELQPYKVEFDPHFRSFIHSDFYEIDLGAPVLNRIKELTTNAWYQRLADDPQKAWEERLSVGPNAGIAEQTVSHALSRFEPVSIFIGEPYAACGIIPKGSAIKTPPLLYIGARASAGKNEQELRKHGFKGPENIAGFLEMLSEFRNLRYPFTHGFEDFNTQDILLTRETLYETYGYYFSSKWHPCISIFHGGEGDTLLLNREGNCGWVGTETANQIFDYCDSIEVLAQAWDNYLQKVGDYFLANAPARWIMPFDHFDCIQYLPE